MKTVRRLLYRDIVSSVLFVGLAFLSLFFFIDFVDELDSVGRRGRTLGHAVLGAVYQLPGHSYELAPIALLIGTIYSLARMAQSSEFTILRTGGLGPGRALGLLAVLGVAFGAVTFAVGDYVVPASERFSLALKSRFAGSLQAGAAGAWLKERHPTPDGDHSVSINLAGTGPSGAFAGLRLFEFDGAGRLVARITAREARIGADGTWTLTDADLTRWPAASARDEAVVVEQRLPLLSWPSSLRPAVVAAAVLPVATMTTAELWRYGRHLADQAQAAQTTEIRFWKQALYPLACVVMVALALPFAYLHARAGGVSLKVFGGILLGISFVLLNNLAGHIGLLRAWPPWVAAAAPSAIYMGLSMAAFAWLVRFR